MDELLAERPENIEIQKRLINFYRAKNRLPEIVEKLDALAEKCLRNGNREGALATLQNLIALEPPNSNDYRRLMEELKKSKKINHPVQQLIKLLKKRVDFLPPDAKPGFAGCRFSTDVNIGIQIHR